jgi:hypothetical protein
VLHCLGGPVSLLQAGCLARVQHVEPVLGRLLPGPARKALWSRRGELTLPSGPAGLSSSVRITCAAVSRLTMGRFGDGHDELLYVIRKPQDRFARVV